MKRSSDCVAASEEEPKAKDNRKGTGPPEVKRPRPAEKKRRFALLIGYVGTNYYGMQSQVTTEDEHPTIEGALLKAFSDSGAVSLDNAMNLGKIKFQRTARTDRYVSACSQVVSCNLLHHEDLVERINRHLPDDIRVFDAIRTTGSFHCKNACTSREYKYLVPTFAFAPMKEANSEFRLEPQRLSTIRRLLSEYVGTHPFHNFTSGKVQGDMSANRFITSIECSDPFAMDGYELVEMTLSGQSFMLHQIRKMLGLVMAMASDRCTQPDAIQTAFRARTFDVPRAPGTGLVLHRVFFADYNRHIQGQHPPLVFPHDSPVGQRIALFKTTKIWPEIIRREKAEKNLTLWLETLPCHSYNAEFGPAPPKRIHTAKSTTKSTTTTTTTTVTIPATGVDGNVPSSSAVSGSVASAESAPE